MYQSTSTTKLYHDRIVEKSKTTLSFVYSFYINHRRLTNKELVLPICLNK